MTLADRIERDADRLLIGVLLLSVVLRLGFLFAFHSELTTRKEKGFYFPALNYIQGHGMGIAADCPTSYRAPLYILFLIPFLAIFGSSYAWPLGLAQMAVAVASVALVYLVGKEWRSKRVGLLGALFMAVYPYNLYHDTQFYITFLFTFFLLVVVLGFLRLANRPKTSTAILTGAAMGLAMLATSGPMVFFAPLGCFWLWRRWGSFRTALNFSVLMTSTALLVMTPWIARNYRVHHAFVPLTTDAGRVFYKDYNPWAFGMMLDDIWIDFTPEPADRAPTPMDGVREAGCDFMHGYTEISSEQYYYRLAHAWIREHAWDIPGLAAIKFTLLWHPWAYPPKGAMGENGGLIISNALMNWVYALSYGFLLAFAALEVILETREERKRTWLFLFLAIAFTITYVVTTPGTKYRVPFDSVMAVMAAAAVWRFIEAYRRGGAATTKSRVLDVTSLNGIPMKRAVVVTPTFNEKENVAAFLAAVAATDVVDVLIVDDGSPDGTAEAVRQVAAGLGVRVWLMRRPAKLGLGTAYLDAFDWIRREAPGYDVVVEMDADFSHDPAALPGLVEAARRCGLAIGSRYVAGGSCPDWPLRRRLLSAAANRYVRLILRGRFPNFDLHDVTAGYVAWKRDVMTALLGHSVRSNGYAFQVETKLLAFLDGARPEERPIAFRDRTRGESKMSRGVIFESALFPWKLLFRNYEAKSASAPRTSRGKP